MSHFVLVPLCLVAIFTAWSASAETESAASESMARPYEEFKPPDPEDQVVCRRERVTGSMIPTRVCKTKRDIRLEKEASQRSMTDMTSQSGVNRGPVNPVTGDN